MTCVASPGVVCAAYVCGRWHAVITDKVRGYICSSVVHNWYFDAGDKPGWLRLAWQYLRRPQLDPISMIGDNKSIMAFNLIWMFDKVCKHQDGEYCATFSACIIEVGTICQVCH